MSNAQLHKKTGLRDSIVPASTKPLFRLIVNGSTNTTGFTAKALTQTPPTSQVLYTESMRAATFVFAAVATAAAKTVNYRITAWIPIEPSVLGGNFTLLPMVIASGQLDTGTLIATTIVAGSLVVDTITDTVARQGTIRWSPADNTPASITVDVQNALLVEVETDLGSAETSAYCWGAPVDAPLPKLA